MGSRKSRFWLLPVLMLVVVLIQPVALLSQCVTNNTVVNTAGPSKQVIKTLNAAYNCSLTMQNAVFCSPTALPQVVSILFGTANTAVTANPSCAWNCACGGVTIDGSDGLPVELMDFSIEG